MSAEQQQLEELDNLLLRQKEEGNSSWQKMNDWFAHNKIPRIFKPHNLAFYGAFYGGGVCFFDYVQKLSDQNQGTYDSPILATAIAVLHASPLATSVWGERRKSLRAASSDYRSFSAKVLTKVSAILASSEIEDKGYEDVQKDAMAIHFLHNYLTICLEALHSENGRREAAFDQLLRECEADPIDSGDAPDESESLVVGAEIRQFVVGAVKKTRSLPGLDESTKNVVLASEIRFELARHLHMFAQKYNTDFLTEVSSEIHPIMEMYEKFVRRKMNSSEFMLTGIAFLAVLSHLTGMPFANSLTGGSAGFLAAHLIDSQTNTQLGNFIDATNPTDKRTQTVSNWIRDAARRTIKLESKPNQKLLIS